jgi:hypothetical protein
MAVGGGESRFGTTIVVRQLAGGVVFPITDAAEWRPP